MSSIAVIVDSDASLPADVAARYGIRQVPISVHFGNQTFKTGVDIDDAALFARVDREGQLPTTSAPSPGDFTQAYQEALDAGAETILCIAVSSEVSGTYGAAVNAVDFFPGRDIVVLDSRTLSMCQGFVAMAAVEAVRDGASKEEVIARARAVGERAHIFGALSTLRYLAMSGRVGHVTAGVANLLSVKPILTVREGKLDLLERVRTQKKAWSRVIELTRSVLNEQPAERMAILHVGDPETAHRFETLVRAELPCPPDVLFAEVTPGLSVHTGAGLIGVVVVAGEA
jgi:DegV family protein with EDD domain